MNVAKRTKRGRSQDRKRVAGGQDYEVRYEAKKTGKSKAEVKRAIKRVGTSRSKVESALGKSSRGGQTRPWTKADHKELKAHSKVRTPVAKISRSMKRTAGALRQQALKLGIGLGHRR